MENEHVDYPTWLLAEGQIEAGVGRLFCKMNGCIRDCFV